MSIILKKGLNNAREDFQKLKSNLYLYKNNWRSSFVADTNGFLIKVFLQPFNGKGKNIIKIDWSKTKRLLFGSLIMLVPENWNSQEIIYTTVFTKPSA